MEQFALDMLPGTVLPFCVVLIQLADSYLRFLPFRSHSNPDEKRRLLTAMGLWSVICFVMYAAFFKTAGFTAPHYKLALMAGWIPWLAIFMAVVRRNTLSHIFVHGMLAVWSFMLHSLSSIIVVAFFKDLPEARFLTIHAMLYPVLVLLLLPLERRFFHDILPPWQYFAERPAGYYITAMPIVVLFSHFILMADSTLIHTWQERVSRLVLPVSFFFMYKYVLLSRSEFYRRKQSGRDAKRNSARIAFLEERCRLAARNQKQLAILRHDLRHNFRILYELISAGKLQDAIAHINTQTILLDAIGHTPVAGSSFLNAAISVHLWRAERLGIKSRQKIKLPSGSFPSENDLTLLTSELLDQAIDTSTREPMGTREISLALVSDGCQWMLSVSCRTAEPLPLGPDGLPRQNSDLAHSMFLEKYGGEAEYSYVDGWNQWEITWYDDLSAAGKEAQPC